MFRYVALVKENNPDSDREAVWTKYQEVLTDWNRDLLVNEISVLQYYGDVKSDDFFRIQQQFTILHSCLESLRTPKSSFSCRLSPDRDIAAINKGIAHLRHAIYCFANGLPENTRPGNPSPRECRAGRSS